MNKHFIPLLIFLLFQGFADVNAVELPQMGDTSGTVISPEEERKLGEAFMRQARRSLKIINDAESQAYIQALGDRLASQVDVYPGKFTFFLVEHESINAFAAPGGFIGVHTGLILATRSESELASVVAHEIAHVTQRHLPRALEEASKMNLPVAAALIAAIVLGQENPNLAEAALATTLAGQQQNRLNFTRGNEKEADRIGIDLLARAGMDPRGMPAFFERLQQSYRFYDNNLPEFLSTHPVTESRISDSWGRADQYPPVSELRDSSYGQIRAKLRVISASSPQEVSEFFRADLKSENPSERNIARYGYGLAAAKAGNYQRSEKYLGDLLAQDPENASFVLAKANVDAAAGKFAEAEELVASALAIYPGHHALTIAHTEILIKAGKPKEARQILREHMRNRPSDPMVYQLYARASREAGYKAESHQALAEYYYSTGETSTAIQQLTVAKGLTSEQDFYLTARIDARLSELKRELADSTRQKK